MTRDEILAQLTNERGEPLVPLSWWPAIWQALEDPAILQVVLWVVRQAGKTTFLATLAIITLLTVPGAYIVFIAASETQAQAIFARKVRRVLERLLRALRIEARSLLITKKSIEATELGSKLEVLSTEASTVPGRSVSLLIIDEGRDIPDEIYTALAPAVIGAKGKIVIGSTAGRPSGFFYELVRTPLPETYVYHSTENENPHADRGVLTFLKRQLALISPTAARRELGNEFVEDGDSFLAPGLIDAAIDDALGELPESGCPVFGFLDLSRKRDLTSLVLVQREPARRPETHDHLVTASVCIWDPKRSPDGQVDFAEVRAAIAALPVRFPHFERLLVDEGAEGGSVIPWAQAQPSLSLKVQGFIATPASNMELWSALAARLHARTLSIPRHERLLAELRGLRQESFAYGGKWRVLDTSRKYHRDVSLALAGACHAAGYRGYPAVAMTAETAETVGESLLDQARGRPFHATPAAIGDDVQLADALGQLRAPRAPRERARFCR